MKSVLFSLLAALALASPIHAGTAAVLSFDGGSGPGAPPGGGATDGWRFSLTGAVTVTHLGFFDVGSDGLAEDHEVGIYTDVGVLLVSTNISSDDTLDDGFHYRAISPLTLQPGTYRIGAYRATGADDSRVEVTNLSTIEGFSHLGGYINGSGRSLSFPNTEASSSYNPCVFGPSFKILTATTKSAVSFSGGSDPGAPGGGATDGWRFALSDIKTVTHLGFFDAGGDGLAEDHDVGIYSDAGVLLVSTTVSSGHRLDGDFRYCSVTPLTLQPGTYRIGAYRATGADESRVEVTNLSTIDGLSHLGGYVNTGSGSLSFPNTEASSSYNPCVFGPSFKTSDPHLLITDIQEVGSNAVLEWTAYSGAMCSVWSSTNLAVTSAWQRIDGPSSYPAFHSATVSPASVGAQFFRVDIE